MHGLSCSAACRIFPNQRLHWCSLHCNMHSQHAFSTGPPGKPHHAVLSLISYASSQSSASTVLSLYFQVQSLCLSASLCLLVVHCLCLLSLSALCICHCVPQIIRVQNRKTWIFMLLAHLKIRNLNISLNASFPIFKMETVTLMLNGH